jgi:hypothetical protein
MKIHHHHHYHILLVHLKNFVCLGNQVALGFLIFAVIGWNLQSVIFSDMSPEERQQAMESISEITNVTQGEQLNETPDTSDSSGEGYVEQGKVYKDSKTGNLIMVEG